MRFVKQLASYVVCIVMGVALIPFWMAFRR